MGLPWHNLHALLYIIVLNVYFHVPCSTYYISSFIEFYHVIDWS